MSVFLISLLPVILIVIIGFVTAKFLPLDRDSLAKLIVYVLAPALVIDSFYRTSLSAKSIWDLLIAFTLTSLLIYLIVLLINKILRLPDLWQKSILATSLFPNNGNLGLGLVTFALGTEGLERALIYMIGSSILMFGFGTGLLKGNNIGFDLNLTLKLPFFWATIIGIILHLGHLEIPFKINESIYQLGITAIPLGLILLGMELANSCQKYRQIFHA